MASDDQVVTHHFFSGDGQKIVPEGDYNVTKTEVEVLDLDRATFINFKHYVSPR